MLSPSTNMGDAITGEAVTGEFSELLGDLVSSDGNLKPIDVAALDEAGIEQLLDLLDIEKLTDQELTPDSPELKQLSILSLLANSPETQVENAELFGNPEIQALLTSSQNKNEQSQSLQLKAQELNNTGLLKANVITADILQQSTSAKTQDMSEVLDDLNLSQFVKDMRKADVDFSSELLAQTGRQESSNTKLVDQLTGLDKPINPLNQLNTQSLKSYSGLENTARAMNRVDVPVNQPGWGEAVGNRLMMMVNGRIQSANIQLNPAELGPIEIRVSVNHDQATVHFVSNNTTVRDAIEEAFPRLKEMFSQNGLSLADANVSQQSSHQSSQHNQQVLSEQNDAMISSVNDSLENSDEQSINANVLDIGLINQYV